MRSQSKALSEIQRVLKPGGYFAFIEHVKSHAPAAAAAQMALTPLQRLLAGNCHLARETDRAIGDQSWTLLSFSRFVPTSAGPIFPHVAGVAQKLTL